MNKAFVLHRRRFSNTSFIIDLFCQNSGHLTVLAKGASRNHQQQAGLLQAFTPLIVDYVGRGQVKTLVHSDYQAMPLMLKGRRLYCGLYANELLWRLLGKEIPYPDLFFIYRQLLQDLKIQPTYDTHLRFFELALLQALGYAPSFSHEFNQQVLIDANKQYQYQHQKGFITCTKNRLNYINGDTLLAFAAGVLKTTLQRQQAKQLMRQMLQPYLGYRPLKTRELFKSL